ncbi:hypothetical protein HNP29_001077 [Pseudomonas alcaligenes]|nr:hypothetical protein [Pseudomonas alcaligenes]
MAPFFFSASGRPYGALGNLQVGLRHEAQRSEADPCTLGLAALGATLRDQRQSLSAWVATGLSGWASKPVGERLTE